MVYDHKSKGALLCALIDRRLSAEQERQEEAIRESQDTPHPELFDGSRLRNGRSTDVDRAVAMAISASMSQEEALQQQMRDWTKIDLKAMAGGPKPDAALLAYLALMGFQCNFFFGFHQWAPEEKARILENIRTMYAAYPET